MNLTYEELTTGHLASRLITYIIAKYDKSLTITIKEL